MRVVEFLYIAQLGAGRGTPRIVVNINNPGVVDGGGRRRCVISAPFFSSSRELGR